MTSPSPAPPRRVPRWLLVFWTACIALILTSPLLQFAVSMAKINLIDVPALERTFLDEKGNCILHGRDFLLPPVGTYTGADERIAIFNREGRTSINAFGARDPKPVTGREKNAVVLLGDSFFFGWGLDDKQTISQALGRLDPERRYINLAVSGFNLCDSVARFQRRYDGFTPPRTVVLQVLLNNDMAASATSTEWLYNRAAEAHENQLFPVGYFLDSAWFTQLFAKVFWKKVYLDPSYERFRKYVQWPLEELHRLSKAHGFKLVLVSFDQYSLKRGIEVTEASEAALHEHLERNIPRLRNWAMKRRVPFFIAWDRIGQMDENTIPDGHPSGKGIERLAPHLLKVLGPPASSPTP